MVGHKVGLSTDAETPSDGLHRRHTNWVVAIATTPKVMQEVVTSLDEVKTDVRRLKQPRVVFEVSRIGTAPVDGYCVEGQPCTVRLRLRRDVNALDCRIVPGSAEWGFVNPRSEIFSQAPRLDDTSGSNLGPAWEDRIIRIMTPAGLQPTANFTFVASYTDCPGWVKGEPPLEYQSEPVPFTIRQVGE
jgi:hypothetical protein